MKVRNWLEDIGLGEYGDVFDLMGKNTGGHFSAYQKERLGWLDDGVSPPKMLEYNADTPTSIFEAAVFQWTWLEQAIERNIIPKRADQFNSIHERLIEAWKKFARAQHLHLAGHDVDEDFGAPCAVREIVERPAGRLLTVPMNRWRGVKAGRRE